MPKSALTEKATTAKSDLWGSPRDLVSLLQAEFQLQWDAAACEKTKVAQGYFGPDHPDGLVDALSIPWSLSGCYRFFLNPPYSLLTEFVEKSVQEAFDGRNLVCALLPGGKTEQPWWHEYVPLASEVRWLKGRLTYLEPERDPDVEDGYLLNGEYVAKSPALFPSVVVIWDGLQPTHLKGAPRMTFWDWRKDRHAA